MYTSVLWRDDDAATWVEYKGLYNILCHFTCVNPIALVHQRPAEHALYSREGPVSGNQEAAQIFIKYMYDLVLEISFFRHQFSKLD